jgi:hypothetical protein
VRSRPELSPSDEFLLKAAACDLIDTIDQIRPSECYVGHWIWKKWMMRININQICRNPGLITCWWYISYY